MDAGNEFPNGIVHLQGRLHVVDRYDDRVYAYTFQGDRDVTADFHLRPGNGFPSGIAWANGRFHIVDQGDNKVYSYTAAGTGISRIPHATAERRTADDIELTEADLREAFTAEERDRAAAGDIRRRRGAHILLEVGDARSEADAIAQLAEVRGQLQAGGSFEDQARELSEDPGSAANGGDLGLVGRDVFDPAFENALWDLAVGELSEPVVTAFGVHLIRLLEIEETEPPTFEDARERLSEKAVAVGEGNSDAAEAGASIDGLRDTNGGRAAAFAPGDTLSDLPAGFWSTDVLSSNVAIIRILGDTTVELGDGGYFDDGCNRYICRSSDGCMVRDRVVVEGLIARLALGSCSKDDQDPTKQRAVDTTRKGDRSDENGGKPGTG